MTPDADLSAEISAAHRVTHGSELRYTIIFFNSGPSRAWHVRITDHLPSGARFLKASTTSGHCSAPKAGTSGGKVRCRLGKINSGQTLRLRIEVTVTATQGALTDRAKVESVTPDPRRSDNAATDKTKV